MFFKKKKKKSNVGLVNRIQFYGDEESDFIIFTGLADEKEQKEEKVWMSLQLVAKILDKEISQEEVGAFIEEDGSKQIAELLKERYNINI